MSSPHDAPATRFPVYFPMPHGPVPGMSISVQAEELEFGRAPLLDTPPTAVGAAVGDVYRVRPRSGGTWWAEEKLESSGICAVLVLPPEPPPVSILGRFAHLGVKGDDFFGIAVLEIPPDADLGAVRRLLDDGVADGSWEYEELCVTDAWKT
ncbi:DUF4265 domain-containing protein [Streptomyces sp. MN03-5084-2B]|nr:DUF4265 domain-containing protein [Streptomyces sp. MN03-5084-2B]